MSSTSQKIYLLASLKMPNIATHFSTAKREREKGAICEIIIIQTNETISFHEFTIQSYSQMEVSITFRIPKLCVSNSVYAFDFANISRKETEKHFKYIDIKLVT